MLTMHHKRQAQISGFSLVELLIVIVVAAVLSAIAIPIYSSNVENAKRSEVTVTMGFVVNFLEIYKGENGHYPISSNWENVVGSDWNDLTNGHLRGTYFLSKYYDYQSTDGIEYKIRCYWTEGQIVDYWVNEKGEWNWEVEEEE